MTNKYLEKIAAKRSAGERTRQSGDFTSPESRKSLGLKNYMDSKPYIEAHSKARSAHLNYEANIDKAFKEVSVGPGREHFEWGTKPAINKNWKGAKETHFDSHNITEARKIREHFHPDYVAAQKASYAAKGETYRAEFAAHSAEKLRTKRLNVAHSLTNQKNFNKKLRVGTAIAGGVAAGVGALLAARKKKD